MSQHDVVVVGAGPVGLLLGAELALGGARVVVVERLAKPSETIKAGSINLASAELLARRGLLPQLRAASERLIERVAGDGADLEAARRTASRAGHFAGIWLRADLVDDSTGVLAGHRECLGATLVPQREIESVLADHATRLGVEVRRGVAVESIVADADSVTVQTDAGPIEASWVVGCDGGRSVVRHAADVGFPGTDPEITGRQAVVELEDDSALTRGWNWSTRGVYCYGPTPGRVLTVEFDGPPADRSAPVTAQELQDSLRRVTDSDVVVTAVQGAATRWTDNARQASSYRRGRVLLAGDAAHVHSPFSGQGLNLGLADAMNLGWKLAAVCTGRAGAQLLDTYTAERHPAAAWVLDWTRAQVALMRPDPRNGPLRQAMTDLMSTREGATLTAAKISGVARTVALDGDHPLVGSLVPDTEGVDGRPLHEAFVDGRFVLAAPAGLDVGSVPDGVKRVAVAGDTAVLVRPDGVVAWATAGPVPPDALVQAMRTAVTAHSGSPR